MSEPLSVSMAKHADTEDFTSIKQIYLWAEEVAKLEAELAAFKRALEQAGQDIHDSLCASDIQSDPHCKAHKDIIALLEASHE